MTMILEVDRVTDISLLDRMSNRIPGQMTRHYLVKPHPHGCTWYRVRAMHGAIPVVMVDELGRDDKLVRAYLGSTRFLICDEESLWEILVYNETLQWSTKTYRSMALARAAIYEKVRFDRRIEPSCG